MEKGFSAPQVCKIIGITYRQLDYWTRTKLISASLVEGAGSGSRRMYGYRDLLELKVIKRLLEAGISLKAIRKALGYLRKELQASLINANIIISSSDVYLTTDTQELVSILKGGQGVLNILALGPIVKELGATIGLMPDGWPEELFPLKKATS